MQKKQLGFGAVEIIIMIVIVALIGGGAWYVWQANNSNNQSQANQSSETSGKNVLPVDKYAGWKQYCGKLQKICFKYPADWVISADSAADYDSARLTSPSGKLAVVYSNPNTRDGSSAAFHTVAIKDLAKTNTDFKIVGGYMAPPSSAPGYWLVGAPFITNIPQAGTQGTYVNSPRFRSQTNFYASFYATPIGAPLSNSESQNWFDSDEVKTSLLILQSFELQ